MGFFDKIRANLSRFMSGRYGVDQLGHEMVICALVMTVIGALTRFHLISLMADALLLLALFRMLSKNRYKRAQENQRIVLEGDVPSPMRMPSGCPFRTRCSRATAQCAQCRPELREVAPGVVAACHNL